jgi:hypothetical protein
MLRSAVISLALLLALTLAAPVVAQGRPDCAAVIRQMNKLSARAGAKAPDPEHIASKLDTDAEWVERCALSYGRRVKRSKPAPDKAARESDARIELTEKREAEEYEEISREEREQQANAVQEDLRSGVYATRSKGPDSSAEWEPYITHEWEPFITHEWEPFIRDDDDPGLE